MIDGQGGGRLAGQILFVLLFLICLFFRLIPLAPGRISWPGPDIFLCLTMAWVLRRPQQVPVLLIAATFLVADIILLQPIGLWAAIVVVATEYLRGREPRWRDLPFMLEWPRIALILAVMLLARRFALAVSLTPQGSLGESLLQYLATVGAYPVVVLAAHWLIGLRRITPAEAEMQRVRG
ncbi:rod shape-determining protein MreD [Paracoccus pacificus]|uniref:Rod shape-determining protein MreD n=1 Tax=Paracoccus pacificus TaxID=1463598 RepID=A0ABW4RBR7_9RHOB